VTATDGNHGRAVARMARLVGARACVYLPDGVGSSAVDAIADEGAEVVRTSLVYDQVVQTAARSVDGRPDNVLIQDTSWAGYEDIPRYIVDGYSTLFTEIDDQIDADVDVLAVPTGVGSLLQAALQHCRSPARADRPAVLAVEPATAACVTASLAAGRPITVDTSSPTAMAGLNCGTVSTSAWPVLQAGCDAAVAVTDAEAIQAVRDLARLGVSSGPSGAATLAGVRAVLHDPHRRAELDLGTDAVVVLLSTEGSQP